MMRKLWTVGLSLLMASPLLAQQGPPPGGGPGGPGAEALRQQVMMRFLQAYRSQAGLTPDQDRRFMEVFRRSVDQRRALQERQQQLWQALEGQMRPGVAANADSVTKLLDAIVAQQAAMVEQTRSEQKDYAQFLTPVQRGQLVLMTERLQQQVQDVVRRRMEMRPGGRMRPDTMPQLELPPM
jgi:hypothetical protein